MIIFLLKILRTLILIGISLFIIQKMLDYYLSKESICDNNTWSKIFESDLKTDIVILGTSRAEAHYNPKIIKNISGFNTYNLGISGTPYNILKIRWDSYINRNNKPKILILDIDDISLTDSKNLYNKFQYLPFTKSNEYQEIAKNIDKDFYFEKYVPLYKYRGYEMMIYKTIRSKFDTTFCQNSFNGYVEHDIKWIEMDFRNFKRILQDEINEKPLNFKKFNNSIQVVEDIIRYCKKKNIKVYLVWSPSYYQSMTYRVQEKKYLDSIIDKISIKYHVKYRNFTDDKIGISKDNFYNSSHLNKRGSTYFSKEIAKFIKEDSSARMHNNGYHK